ncbi:hypothetical protein HYPBUDRAFT_6234 [Hyphopichia burtonii NRRL Y-1933]|uniref:Uncharacterized protein n=1 Tax=Hyphopichia burtonii NRRL Y-1933 TaxID=984485 RepID=A0A1E4RI76_9ASCO|nr:hypothetical protein HYPBUDRAFT_6234 [Hyphopichia burtonii NRRL Y-1933]ODV66931.1 hypothetical protein HYPBUDRAFT_6234 [Hyphopichia burtonii NRRL Y-1933]
MVLQSEFDQSFAEFDSSNLLDSEELKLDYDNLLEGIDDKSAIEKLPNNSEQNLLNIENSPNLKLSPILSKTNSITNDLFKVTKQLRLKSEQSNTDDIFGLSENEESIFSNRKLNNDKVTKLMNQLNEKDEDLELDDQLRSRVFKGRFTKNLNPTSSLPDNLDLQLNSYLSNSNNASDENKENLSPYPDPLKSIRNKDVNSIKKSGKIFFKAPPKKTNTSTKSQIPILKPLSNLTNVDLRKPNENYLLKHSVQSNNLNHIKSPKRICTPKSIIPSKPSIKYQQRKHNIFIVDSLTGLINDATQFGTELNASNCEGFPLPEDVNEIVQIPTNDDTSNDSKPLNKKPKSKMAIIKALHNKYFSIHKKKSPKQSQKDSIKKIGFYSKIEFDKYCKELQKEKLKNPSDTNTNEVELVSQQPIPPTSNIPIFSNKNILSKMKPAKKQVIPEDDETETDRESENDSDRDASDDKENAPTDSNEKPAMKSDSKKRKVRWAQDLEW